MDRPTCAELKTYPTKKRVHSDFCQILRIYFVLHKSVRVLLICSTFTSCMFQDKEEKGEEDEGQVNIIPKWKAGQTTGIHLASEDDDLEETPPEETTADPAQDEGMNLQQI